MLSLIALLAVVRGAWAAFWWEPERPCVDPVKFTPPDKQRRDGGLVLWARCQGELSMPWPWRRASHQPVQLR